MRHTLRKRALKWLALAGLVAALVGCQRSCSLFTTIDPDDVLLAAVPEAQLVVRVHATKVYPNCPRYIHRYELVKRSRFVPQDDCLTPVPEWKRSDWAIDSLPADDPARDPGERDVLGR